MKMRKLFAGIAAAATLLGGMALGAVSAQADDAATTADTAAITVKNSQEGHTYAAYKFATLTAHQLHGGMGYMREFDLHLWSERAKASELLGGPAAVQSRRLERAMSLVG